MNSTKLAIAAVAIGLLGLAPAVSAQQAEVPYLNTGTQMFSVHAGGQIFDIGDQLDTLGTDLETQWNLGARYQYALSPYIGLEGNVMFSPSEFDFVGPGIGTRDTNALYYTGNIVYHIAPSAPVIPYLTGGAGAVSLMVDRVVDNVEDTSTETRFVGNFGGGLLFPVAERFGLKFEIRDYIYRLDNLDTQFADDVSFPAGFEETVNDLSITGGFSILF